MKTIVVNSKKAYVVTRDEFYRRGMTAAQFAQQQVTLKQLLIKLPQLVKR